MTEYIAVDRKDKNLVISIERDNKPVHEFYCLGYNAMQSTEN
jgi:hypothetical protein